jgi:hypothetical protein
MRVGTTEDVEVQVVLQVVERAESGALGSLTRTCKAGRNIMNSKQCAHLAIRVLNS